MLEIAGLTVVVEGRRILDRVDLTVGDGDVVAVLGPSGSGKTTLLRAIAGLQPPVSGSVRWDGEDLGAVPPHRRGFGLMFQDYALFPHLDVAGNVAFGLRMTRTDPATKSRRIAEVLEWVGLPGMERRQVGSLSGGEQQRVALARSLAPAPRLLMLDEPLGSLDRTLRDRLAIELRDLLDLHGITTLHVTHDQEEAFALADRLVLLRAGAVVQHGTAQQMWSHPADAWTARFLGFNNVIEVDVGQGWALTPWGRIPVDGAESGKRTLVLRPDGLRVDPVGPIMGVVRDRVFRGSTVLLRVSMDGGPSLEAEVALAEAPAPGETVRLGVDPAAVVVLGSGS